MDILTELKKQLTNKDNFLNRGSSTDVGQEWLSRTKELLAKVDHGMAAEFDELGRKSALPLSSLILNPMLARMVVILRNAINYIELAEPPKKINKPIEEFSDAELLAVIRKAENSNIPGSQYQCANNEWQIRHQQKVLEATKNGRNGIFFEVGGNMKNNGVIQTAKESTVDIAVAGDYSSDNSKIIQNDYAPKKWYEKPLGIVGLMVVGGVIVGLFLFLFGWN